MNDQEAKILICDALEFASVFYLRDRNLVEKFTAGEIGISISVLEMDSLAAMELCLAIEANTGKSIVPEAFGKIKTLNSLSRIIAEKNQPADLNLLKKSEGDSARTIKIPDRSTNSNIVNLYIRARRLCRTENDVNKLSIRLENRITPTEFSELLTYQNLQFFLNHNILGKTNRKVPSSNNMVRKGDRSVYRLNGGNNEAALAMSLDFINETAFRLLQYKSNSSFRTRSFPRYNTIKLFRAAGKKEPEEFSRKKLGKNIYLYYGRDDRPGKTLIVCFAGNAQRMMMPMPVFLQQFDARRFEVLFAYDSNRNGFRGAPGQEWQALEKLIDRIGSICADKSYARIVGLGTSGGGLPAIFSSLKLDFDAILAVGGNDPNEARWKFKDGDNGALMLAKLAKKARLPNIFLAYGSKGLGDLRAAEETAKIVSASIIQIGETNDSITHAPLVPLVKAGHFIDFLDKTILR